MIPVIVILKILNKGFSYMVILSSINNRYHNLYILGGKNNAKLYCSNLFIYDSDIDIRIFVFSVLFKRVFINFKESF